MLVEGSIWARYERAVQGFPVNENGDFEWMLESVDEFELRVLVRHFDQREALLERIGEYEHGATPLLSPGEAEALATVLADSYRRAARKYAPGEFTWAGDSTQLEIRSVPSDYPASRTREYRWLFDAVNGPLARELNDVTGAVALKTVLLGRVRSLGLYHLLGPLLDSEEFDFSAELSLGKSGRALWIEDGGLFLRDPLPDPYAHRDDSSGWQPELHWPTDEDIRQHQTEYRSKLRGRTVGLI